MVCVTGTELHPDSVTVNDTDLLPIVDQLTECGPCDEALAGVAFVPKFHRYVAVAAEEPVYEITVGAFKQLEAGNVNEAIGSA